MSIPAKNENTSKNNNLLKIKRILNTKISAKGVPVFTFTLPGGRLAPLPPASHATVENVF